MIAETVYSGRDNEIVLAFETQNAQTGVRTALSLANVTRMRLELRRPNASSATLTVDTADGGASAAGITWDGAAGEVTLALGDIVAAEPVPPGVYDARLVAVDGAGDQTQLLHEQGTASLRLRIASVVAVV